MAINPDEEAGAGGSGFFVFGWTFGPPFRQVCGHAEGNYLG